MKKSIQNRIRKGLFPEMPQSFADRLTGALKIGGAFNADQRSAEEAPTAPVLPERSKRRFPFGKIFNGVAAAVLAALCIVIAVFGIILPNVQKTHGATRPDGYRADFPVGMWTRTRSKYASQGTDYSWIDVDMESWQSWLEITADGHAHLTEYDSESGKALHADFSVAIGSDGIQTDWESCTGMWYDTAADTICMEIVGRRRDYYSRTPDAVIPEIQTTDTEIAATAKRNAAGIWKSGEGDTLWITDDGTARSEALSGLTGNLTYTVEDGTLHFSLTGTDFTFTARYDESKDTLSVTANGNTKLYSRVTGSIAGKWKMTGIDLLAADFSAEKTGWKMYLEIFDDGSMITVKITDDAAERTAYRLLHVDENTFTFEEDTGAVVTSSLPPWKIVYDAATDTLRMEYDFGINPTPVFSRMPDSAVDALQQEYKRLEKQYPEYFGLDISKGLKVYVWQMSNDGYFCALLAGSDNKTNVEIGGMKGTTIEEMLLILNTYEIEDNDIDVEVVPFRNPLSSYWYEIDEAYTEKLVWLLNGTPNPAPFLTESSESGETAYQVDDPDHILNVLTDVKVCDVDGDGRLESCRLSLGPTSGLFTVVFTVYRNGTLAYRNTFNMDYGTANFVPLDEGLSLEFVFAKNEPWTVKYLVTIENGVIVLTNILSGNQVEYWGELDPQWNRYTKKAVERRFDGAWYSFSKGLLSDPAYDQLLLISFDPDGEHVSFTEDRTRYEGYTYRIEPGDKPAIVLTDEKTGDVRRAVLDGTTLTFESAPHVNGERSAFEYTFVPSYEAADLPYAEPILPVRTETSANWRDMPFCMFDLDGDGEKELIELYWDETSRSMQIKVIKPQTKVKEVQLPVMPHVFTSDEQAILYTVEDVTDPGNLILIDLDSNDGRVNLLVSATRADGTERTYELHVEGDAIVCGHTVEGYCFLNDSEQQELMLATPTDLLGAKFGYREVRGEALEPVDEWLQARALIERIMFVKREENIGDGTLLHLVRALPCEIDGKPATLEPGVYLHLREWHESMDRIVFMTEDDRWITVYLDGTAPYTVGGIPLADYFDNAPKG